MLYHSPNLLIDACDEILEEWMDEFDNDVSEVGAAIGEHDYARPILRQDILDKCHQHFFFISLITSSKSGNKSKISVSFNSGN